MSNFDVLVVESGKPKRRPSSTNTFDFLSVKVGASGLELKEGSGGDSGKFSFSDKDLVDVTSIEIGSSGLKILEATGHFAFSSKKLTSVADPTAAQDAATKAYVDAVANGLDIKNSARLATAAALPAYTPAGSGVGKTLTANANGALSVDGVAVAVNDRVLVKNEGASHADHGLYAVTATGDGSNPFVLTRTTDADQNVEVTANMFTFISEGTVNADTGWVLVTNDPITVDTTALAFTQFSAAGQIEGGAGLLKTGNVLSVELDTAANANGGGSGGGTSGLEFDTSGDGGKLRVDVAAAATGSGFSAAIQRSSNGLQVAVDNSTIEGSTTALNVKAAGINENHLAASVAGDGLTGGAGSPLAVGAGDGISVAANAVAVSVAAIAGTNLEDDGSNNLRIAASAAGAGLTGGGASALAVGAGEGIVVNANDVALNPTVAGDGLTYTSGVVAVGSSATIAVAADSVSVDFTEDFVNDNAGSITVRQIVYIKSDGDVDLAQANGTFGEGTKFGMVSDASIATTATGAIYVRPGAKVPGFTGLTIGGPVYLSRSSAGGYQQDLSGFVAGEHVVRLGFAYSATVVELNPSYLFEY